MDQIQKGKKIVLAMIITILLISVLATVSISTVLAVNGYKEGAMLKMAQGGFRLLWTMVLCFFLYKGRRWAKGFLVVLFLISGVMSLISLTQAFHVVMLLLGLIYTSFGIGLMTSQSINEFFSYQREKI